MSGGPTGRSIVTKVPDSKKAVLDFFRYELPATFRATFRYTLIAFLVTIVFAGIGAVVTAGDEAFAENVVPGLRDNVIAHRDWTKKINDSNPVHSALIQRNNIGVCAMAFGGGLLFGLGTLYILLVNGLMLGVVVQLCVRYEFHDILIFITATACSSCRRFSSQVAPAFSLRAR
ncbi:MAG: stage II sporulation protein M [Blastocatellia bacterium]|nr:stage II sporulation protein M [Blastocatellia bacterium]